MATRFELREPNKRFPFGCFRANSIAFLVTASVLSIVGVSLLYDAIVKLVHRERPPIGTMTVFGHQFWAGWAMIAVLVYCVAIGLLLGKLQKPVAEKLNDKAVGAEADMNRAGWMSEGAAIIGIGLVALGYWWGDAVAAAFISIEIVRDGWENLRQVIGDLMDEAPTQMGRGKLEDIADRVKAAAERLDWVSAAAVRLREQGRVIGGDVLIVPRDERDLLARVAQAQTELRKVDWRLHSLMVIPTGRDGADPHAQNGTNG